ncbi:MAG: hypothetical protein IKA36_06635 [Clostridia bacterium]|nr:hypothetical protein [Clostridia bacterium]
MVKTKEKQPKAKSKLKTLVAMQLKDRLDFSHFKDKKKAIFKTVYSIALFALITFVINLIFGLIVSFNLFSLMRIFNFRAYLILMTVILALSFLSCLTNLTKTLYFSKDNPVLLTMPTTSRQIFTSRLIVVFIYELLKNLYYILPFLFAYGLTCGFGITYFLWTIISMSFLTLFMVVVSGLLSIPAMFIAIIMKKFGWLKFITISAIATASIYLVVKFILLIPTDIDLVRDFGKIFWQLQDVLNNFAKSVILIDFLLQFLTGARYGNTAFKVFTSNNMFTILTMFVVMVVAVALIYSLVQKIFLKMASSPFEYKKVLFIRNIPNRVHRPFTSVVKTEIKKDLSNSNALYTLMVVAVITPIAVLLQNKIISAMDTRIVGDELNLTFNILTILLIILSSNVSIASLYSREGNSAYLNKSNPASYATMLFGKLVPYLFVNTISIIVSCGIIQYFAKLTIANIIVLTLALIFMNASHVLWSAEYDVMNPQNHQYQTTGEHQKNPNENKSTILAFLMSFLFFVIMFFLISEDSSTVFMKLFFIATAIFVLRVSLYFRKVRLYYKEK